MAPQHAVLADGRRHFNHGPIDLIVEAFGAADETARAYDQAWARFGEILIGLTRELRLLRRPIQGTMPMFEDRVARRMAEAVWPFREKFITPMSNLAM